jgi:hypothetical protein
MTNGIPFFLSIRFKRLSVNRSLRHVPRNPVFKSVFRFMIYNPVFVRLSSFIVRLSYVPCCLVVFVVISLNILSTTCIWHSLVLLLQITKSCICECVVHVYVIFVSVWYMSTLYLWVCDTCVRYICERVTHVYVIFVSVWYMSALYVSVWYMSTLYSKENDGVGQWQILSVNFLVRIILRTLTTLSDVILCEPCSCSCFCGNERHVQSLTHFCHTVRYPIFVLRFVKPRYAIATRAGH